MPESARNRSIRTAIWTSLLSKGGTALLQLVAMPFAVRVLGWEQFGLYASVAGVLMTVQLFELGLGPALTHRLAKAVADGDRDGQRALVSTSFFLLLGMAVVAALALGLVATRMPVAWLFGAPFAAHQSELESLLSVGLILGLLLLLFNHTERVREGCLEAWYNNAWGAAGNVAAAALIAAGMMQSPSTLVLLLAVFGTAVVAKFGNTLLLWLRRPWLIPSWANFRPALVRWLLADSLAWLMLVVVAALIEFYVVQNLYGRLAGPTGVTAYAVLTTLTTAGLGLVLMVTTPTWPAIVDAAARGDTDWIRCAARRLQWFAVAVALAAGTAAVTLGPSVLPVWLGDRAVDLDRRVLAAFAIYFLFYVWRHTHHMLLIGLGRVRWLAVLQCGESALVLVAAWVGMRYGGLPGLLLAMAAVMAMVTGWVLPWGLRRDLRLGVDPVRL